MDTKDRVAAHHLCIVHHVLIHCVAVDQVRCLKGSRSLWRLLLLLWIRGVFSAALHLLGSLAIKFLVDTLHAIVPGRGYFLSSCLVKRRLLLEELNLLTVWCWSQHAICVISWIHMNACGCCLRLVNSHSHWVLVDTETCTHHLDIFRLIVVLQGRLRRIKCH